MKKLWVFVKDHHRLLIACVILGWNIVITSKFVTRMNLISRLQTDHRMVLPVATNSRSKDDPSNTFTVTIADDGHLEAEGQPVNETQLRALVGNRRETRIYVRASRRVRYLDLKKVLVSLGSVGGKTVVFSVFDPTPTPSSRENLEGQADQR
jgi:biopolymer transport protein ExbD